MMNAKRNALAGEERWILLAVAGVAAALVMVSVLAKLFFVGLKWLISIEIN
jgi:hypothetical protein